MDDSATVDRLKLLVRQFCEERDWDQFHTPKELAIGICTEAGELLDKFRFLSDEQVEELLVSERRSAVEEEVADVLFFLLRFAQRFNFDLETSLLRKIEINGEKYPVEKAKGRNLKSSEL